MRSRVLASKRSADRKSPGGRRWEILVGALAASWIVPFALDALNLDIVLIPIFVLAIGSVLRTGGGLLDRLVIATLVLCGGVLALGLVMSFWPWGLAPVPTAGLILSTVSLVAWIGRRRPRLPLRFRTSDLMIVGTVAVVWHYIHHPLVGRSLQDRLPFVLSVEDRFIHFSIFDAVHQLGGYPFLDQTAGKLLLKTPTEAVYPQGSHFLLAWFDVFARSATDLGDSVAAYNRYYLYVLASFAVLCGLIVWGARWIGGPRLTGWRTAVVCTAVAGLVVTSPLAGMIRVGFDSQIGGLLFLTAAIPLIVRPAMGWGTYASVSAAALVAVAYTYNILAAFVGVALVVGALVYRKRQARHRWWLYAVQVVGAAVAVIPSLLSVLADFDVESQAQARGMYLAFDRSLLVGLAALVVVVVLMPGNRRTGVSQALLLTVAGGAFVIGVFGAWQMHTIGNLSYYFEKLAVGGLVIVIMGIGAAGTLLRRFGPSTRPFGRGWWTEAVASVAALAAGLSLFGGVQWGVPSVAAGPTAFQSSELVAWSRGKGGDLGPAAKMLINRDMKRVKAPTPVIALYSNDGYLNWRVSFLAVTLTNKSGVSAAYDDLLNVFIGAAPVEKAQWDNSFGALTRVLNRVQDKEVVLLVADRPTAERLRHDLPAVVTDKKVTVLDAPFPG
ncbi:hypothetical protein OHV05_13360 [Kitasatospora sp. NBC_00070]|uniref:hypothetical protein n=1 Tax=Kitasatospora sp. NBC_00070 TaxID=2975962 RepID=UPI00324EA267